MPNVSRRSVVKGTALAGAVAAVAGLAGCGTEAAPENTGPNFSGEPQVVDEKEFVNVTEAYKNVDNTLQAQSAWDLPLGTVSFHCEGAWAALILTPESARSVNMLGIISLASGNLSTLIEKPTQGRSYCFHDVRCSESVYAWVEMDYITHDWVLIAQGLENGMLKGDAVQLDKGNVDWEPARFTTTGTTVVWQKMPMATGSKSTESSHCLSWSVGDAKSADLYTSPGRFATWPRACDGILTIAPRVNVDEGTFYGLTALDLKNSAKTHDQLVMPQNISPFEAIYMNGSFAFSVEANYGYGGGLGNMGTFIGREGGPFVFLSREPLACVAGKGSRYLIKAQSSHFVVDTDAQTFAVLPAPDKSLEYGDYPASAGVTDRFATYATVRGDNGLPSHVHLRVFGL